MTRKLYLPAIVMAVFFVVLFALSPYSARAQGSPWDSVIIEPESGNWNYPGYFIVTATVDVTLSWEIKCTEGDCFGRQAEFVFDYFLAAGESVRIGWGDQCYRWQFDPIDWDHGYIAEPDPEVCALLTVTPTTPSTPTATPETPTTTPDTPTPTSTETLVTTPPTTPGTATPTSTGTLVTTPPTTPGTATPTSTGTLVTTPPTTPGTATTTPTATATSSTPNQSPTETPRSQLIAVTGADLSGPSHLARLFVSLGVVLLGLGLVRLGLTRKSRNS